MFWSRNKKIKFSLHTFYLSPGNINAAFYMGLHCNRSSEKDIQYFFLIITCDLSIYTMDHPDFIVCSFYGKFHWSEMGSSEALPFQKF